MAEPARAAANTLDILVDNMLTDAYREVAEATDQLWRAQQHEEDLRRVGALLVQSYVRVSADGSPRETIPYTPKLVNLVPRLGEAMLQTAWWQIACEETTRKWHREIDRALFGRTVCAQATAVARHGFGIVGRDGKMYYEAPKIIGATGPYQYVSFRNNGALYLRVDDCLVEVPLRDDRLTPLAMIHVLPRHYDQM